MNFKIKNFTNTQTIDIETATMWDGFEQVPLVRIFQRGGSMLFQLDLREDQARFMATALSMALDEAANKAKTINSLLAEEKQ